VGSLSLNYSTSLRGLDLEGGYLYLTDYYSNLMIVNAQDPGNPKIVSETSIPYPGTLAVSGNYTYVEYISGLRVFNTSNKSAPVVTTDISLFSIQELSIHGDKLFAFTSIGLSVYDISAPEAPSFLGGISSMWNSYGGVYDGSRYAYLVGYVNSGTNGVQVIDVQNPSTPAFIRNVIPQYFSSLYLWDAVIVGTDLYVGTYSDGLFRFDISNPAIPVFVGNYLSSSSYTYNIESIRSHGSYLFYSDYDHLTMFNISSREFVGAGDANVIDDYLDIDQGVLASYTTYPRTIHFYDISAFK